MWSSEQSEYFGLRWKRLVTRQYLAQSRYTTDRLYGSKSMVS
jgi:hypothetical protein